MLRIPLISSNVLVEGQSLGRLLGFMQTDFFIVGGQQIKSRRLN